MRAPIRIVFARPMAVDRAHHLVVILSGPWRAFASGGVEGPAVAFRRSAAAKFLVLALLLSAPPTFAAQQPDSPSPAVLDRAVAVVNKHVILASDLDDEIRLSVLDPNTVPQVEITRQQALEQLISRTLIEQQIRQQDIEAIEPSQEEVNARLHEIRTELPICVRQNCASDAGWKAFLAAHGLTAQRVEAYLRYRLEILRFIEQRFRQGIQISSQQIETYYHDTLLPQYASGETVPPLDQVAPRLQEILLQQQVNELFDNWLTDLRRQGDVDVLDSDLAPELAPPPATAPAPQPAPATATPARPGAAKGGKP
ncbi:MAG: SurA N-terminal domain-containing protein [Terracidiphilus sp.]